MKTAIYYVLGIPTELDQNFVLYLIVTLKTYNIIPAILIILYIMLTEFFKIKLMLMRG